MLVVLHFKLGFPLICLFSLYAGTAKVTADDIKVAAPLCTHLIYGFAAIDDDDYHIEPIDKKLDLDKGKTFEDISMQIVTSSQMIWSSKVERYEKKYIFVDSRVNLLKSHLYPDTGSEGLGKE